VSGCEILAVRAERVLGKHLLILIGDTLGDRAASRMWKRENSGCGQPGDGVGLSDRRITLRRVHR